MNIFDRGGYVLMIILSSSVIALTIIIERWRFYRKIEQEEQEVMPKIRQVLTMAGSQSAVSTLAGSESFLVKVCEDAVENCKQGDKADATLEDRIASIIPQMDQYLYILATIATIAPLLGLLGTVFGMIKTFHVASFTGVSDPHQLAEGISEALYNTAAGLLVTVPCVIAHNHYRSRADRLLQLLERRAHEIIRLITKRGDNICR